MSIHITRYPLVPAISATRGSQRDDTAVYGQSRTLPSLGGRDGILARVI
jgi:hypothetical protein